MKSVFGITELDDAGMARLRAASPEHWLSARTPPFLFIHGTKDAAVPYEQATLAMDLFRKAGRPAELITVPDGAHGVINWEREARFQGYKEPLLRWLRARLR